MATDPIIERARQLLTEKGITLDELGKRMGFEGDVARKAAWQFLNKVADPRLSTLRKFASAIGIPVAELLVEQKEKPKKK